MTRAHEMHPMELRNLLIKAKESKAPASLRAVGSPRMLGDLQVRGLELDESIHLMGVKGRDQLLPAGTDVMLSMLVGDDILSARSVLQEPIISTEGDTLFPPILRVAWPKAAIESHRRKDVRVATPDLPSLPAQVECNGRTCGAHLLNLTETGVGLGFDEYFSVPLRSILNLQVDLPGGVSLKATGEVRHAEFIEGERCPARLGLVLGGMTSEALESLRRFIQARRMDRSDEMRKAY